MPAVGFNLVAFFGPGGWDSVMRILLYVSRAEESARGLLEELADGGAVPMTEEALGTFQRRAVDQRNALLLHMRDMITPFGRAFSEALKDEGKALQELLLKYTLRALSSRQTVHDLLGLVNLNRRGARWVVDDLVDLLGGAAPNPLSSSHRTLQDVYADAISRAAGALDEQRFASLLARAARGRRHRLARMLLLRFSASREVTQALVEASGRTNPQITTLAKVWGGLSALAIVGSLTVTIVYAADVKVPRHVLNALALPGTTPVSLASTAAQIVSSLGMGYVAQQVGRGCCGLVDVKSMSTGARVCTILSVYLFPSLLLAVLLSLFVWDRIDFEWSSADLPGNWTNATGRL
jgi:hypothetical protein